MGWLYGSRNRCVFTGLKVGSALGSLNEPLIACESQLVAADGNIRQEIQARRTRGVAARYHFGAPSPTQPRRAQGSGKIRSFALAASLHTFITTHMGAQRPRALVP
jgi:hypothetical protein